MIVIEEQRLRAEKEKLMNYVGGDKTRMKELQKLMAFTSKGKMLTEFEDDTFLAFVDSITVESRAQVVFCLKCGMNLRERLQIVPRVSILKKEKFRERKRKNDSKNMQKGACEQWINCWDCFRKMPA